MYVKLQKNPENIKIRKKSFLKIIKSLNMLKNDFFPYLNILGFLRFLQS